MPTVSTVVWSDTFAGSAGDLNGVNGWQVIAGTALDGSGNVKTPHNFLHWAEQDTNQHPAQNYGVQVTATPGASTAWTVGASMRNSSAAGDDGVFATVHESGDILLRDASGVIGSASGITVSGTWTVLLECIGNQAKVYFNGVQKVSATIVSAAGGNYFGMGLHDTTGSTVLFQLYEVLEAPAIYPFRLIPPNMMAPGGVPQAWGGATATSTAPITLDAPTATLTLSGVTPTVTGSGSATHAATAATLTLTGVTPTITGSGNATSPTATVATVTLTGVTPTVSGSGNATAAAATAATLTLTGVSSTAAASGNAPLTATAATLTLTGQTPTATGSGNATASLATAATVTLTGVTPTAAGSGNNAASLATAATLTLTGVTPTATVSINLTAPTATLTLTGVSATVTGSGSATARLATAATLTLAGATPTVTGSGTGTVAATAAVLTLAGQTPTAAVLVVLTTPTPTDQIYWVVLEDRSWRAETENRGYVIIYESRTGVMVADSRSLAVSADDRVTVVPRELRADELP